VCRKIILFILGWVLVLSNPDAGHGESIFSSLGLGEGMLPATGRGLAMGGTGIALVDTTSSSLLNPASGSLLNRVTLSVVYSPEVRLPKGPPDVSRNWDSRLSSVKFVFPLPRRIAVSLGLLLWGDMNAQAQWTGENSSSEYAGSYEREGGIFSLPFHVSAGLTEHIILAGGFDLVQISSRETWIKDFPSGEYQDSEDDLEGKFSGARPSGGILLLWPGRASFGFVFNGPRDLDGTLVTRPVFETEYERKTTLHLPASYGAGLSLTPTPAITLVVEGQHTQWRDFRLAGESVLPSRTSNRISVGFEWASTRRTGSWFSRLPLRVGYWREPEAFDWPAGERVVSQMLTLGTGFPMSGNSAHLDLALEVGRIGNESDNGVAEQIIRLSVGFTASERWQRKRQTRY
jgi:hypothetical protein